MLRSSSQRPAARGINHDGMMTSGRFKLIEKMCTGIPGAVAFSTRVPRWHLALASRLHSAVDRSAARGAENEVRPRTIVRRAWVIGHASREPSIDSALGQATAWPRSRSKGGSRIHPELMEPGGRGESTSAEGDFRGSALCQRRPANIFRPGGVAFQAARKIDTPPSIAGRAPARVVDFRGHKTANGQMHQT